jgi:cytochrome P450
MFIRGTYSWLHVLFEKSYKMKMGQVKLPGIQIYMVNQPELVKKVMVNEVNDFPKHEMMGKILKPLLGESIFTTNGDVWRRQRDMMNDSFSHTKLKRVFPLMYDAIELMLERFAESLHKGSVNIDMEMTHVTADIIFRTILSHPLSADEANRIFTAFNKYQVITQRIMVFESYRLPCDWLYKRSEKQAHKIRNVLAPIIKKRHDIFLATRKDNNKDILNSLMKAKDKEGKSFSYEELVDHISMLFLAGHETSASALTWSLYLLANCTEAQQNIRSEVNRILSSREEKKFEYEDMKNLKYTKAVFFEALRLYPPVGFFNRQAMKNCTMRDKKIKAGDSVMISPWLLQRHRNEWNAPDYFIPERFMDDGKPDYSFTNEAEQKDDNKAIKQAYIPFGLGQRICIGKGFAIQEAVLALATLVHNFEFKNLKNQTPEPVGRVTIRPKKAIKLQVKKTS